jgi:hypothetical protein
MLRMRLFASRAKEFCSPSRSGAEALWACVELCGDSGRVTRLLDEGAWIERPRR